MPQHAEWTTSQVRVRTLVHKASHPPLLMPRALCATVKKTPDLEPWFLSDPCKVSSKATCDQPTSRGPSHVNAPEIRASHGQLSGTAFSKRGQRLKAMSHNSLRGGGRGKSLKGPLGDLPACPGCGRPCLRRRCEKRLPVAAAPESQPAQEHTNYNLLTT